MCVLRKTAFVSWELSIGCILWSYSSNLFVPILWGILDILWCRCWSLNKREHTTHEFFDGYIRFYHHFFPEVHLGEWLYNAAIDWTLVLIIVYLLKMGMTAGSPIKLSQVSVSRSVHLVGYLGSTCLSLS